MSDPKIFTRAEAERTLPLVRRIVGDVQAEYPIWRAAVARFEVLSGSARADLGETDELRTAREEAAESAARINGFLQELEAIGCQFKGFESGLVDFYSLRNDRLVFLCWQLVEDRITHWHEVDAGYAGRQPLESDLLSQTSS